MFAVKGNKVYTISESEKARYIAMGYDITEGDEVVAYGKGKTVAYDEYVKVLKENEVLKKELDALKQEDSNANKTSSNADKTEKKTTNKSAKE